MASEVIAKVTAINGESIEAELIAELVRCKNCKYFGAGGCSRLPRIVIASINWFCADGVRKE